MMFKSCLRCAEALGDKRILIHYSHGAHSSHSGLFSATMKGFQKSRNDVSPASQPVGLLLAFILLWRCSSQAIKGAICA